MLLALPLALALGTTAQGADPAGCPLPPVLQEPAAEASLFTPEQEAALGDAAHEAQQAAARVIDDEQLQAPLASIAERLLRHLPASPLRFRFFLSDLPMVNAFALPGGRIYVTRKLIAAVRDEDELAGVVAHELGHSLRRDAAVAVSHQMRKALGVTHLEDRQDVYDKFHLLLESSRRKPGAFRGAARDDDRDQAAADAVAIHALARAGYRPEALADLWDRVQETHGRTGSWLTDIFGGTPPEARRLREMLRTRAALPATCQAARPGGPEGAQAFRAWQAAVVAYDGLARQESLPGLTWRRPLEPPLQPDVRHLRFSPDGRFVLAQDDASLFVFSREPFALRFSVEAPEAEPAQFSPDSRELVFHTPSLRVERWDLSTGSRLDVNELTTRSPCLDTALSPDGRYLACYDATFSLTLLEVETGAEILERKAFFSPNTWAWAQAFAAYAMAVALEGEGGEAPDLVQLAFSPDARYFVAGADRTTPLAFDLVRRATFELPGALRKLTQHSFTFVGPDRLAGLDPQDSQRSGLVRFPGGEPLARLALSQRSRLAASTDSGRLLMRPLHEHPVAAMDLASQKVFLANKRGPALDLHGDLYVSEAGDGTLELRRLGSDPPTKVASVQLPRSRLGHLRAAAVSPDLRWLAVSQRYRGAGWSLERGQRALHLRGFRGAALDVDGVLCADFPPHGKLGRTLARMSLPGRATLDQRPIAVDGGATLVGPLLLVTRPDDANEWLRRITLEAHDACSGRPLWSRRFADEAPTRHVAPDGSTITLAWALSTAAAKRAAAGDPDLRARLASLKQKEGDYLLEALDARTGRTLGRVVVETSLGSFRVWQAQTDGDWLALQDSQRRTLLYSLASGVVRGKAFGERSVLSAAAGLLAVEVRPGRLTLYSLETMQTRAELAFASPLSLVRFSADGRRLLALTTDQTAYLFDTGRW